MRKLTILAIAALVSGLLAAPAAADGPNKASIAGTATLTIVDPGDGRVTPGGVAHEFEGLALYFFNGDLEGTLSLQYRGNSTLTADGSVLVARAMQSGELTWNDRKGEVSGMVVAKCELAGFLFACHGTSTLHGSGELDGVTFRTTADGTFGLVGDFTYEGFAVDPHG